MNDSKENNVKIRYFEDFMRIAGCNGRINIFIFIFCSLGTLCNPLVSYTYGFLGATPDHWCDVEALQNSSFTLQQIKHLSIPQIMKNGEETFATCKMYDINYTNILHLPYEDALQSIKESNPKSKNCNTRFFNSTVETVTTKWDLVCEKRVIYSTIQAAIYFGFLVSSVLLGYLLDKLGRLPIYRICVMTHIIIGLAGSFSPSVQVFTVVKFFQAVTAIGYYIAGFVIAIELTTCKQRSIVASYFVLPFAFGIMLAAIIAYFIRPWYYLQAALVLPNFLLLIGSWILPESPRWLITVGRHEEAAKILESIAKSNGRTMPNPKIVKSAMQKLENEANSENRSEAKSLKEKIINESMDFVALLTHSQLKSRTISIFFCWFCVSLIYYGISLGSPALNVNEHLFILLSGAIEVPAYLLLLPMAVYFGRKVTLISTYYTCGITIISVLILVLTTKFNELLWLKMTLFIIGKFGIVIAFHLLWVYTAELYPTKYRSLAVGQSSTFARVGSICSPYISDILGTVASWSPSAVFGVLSILAGTVSFIFPETNNKKLADGLGATTFDNDSDSETK